MSGSILHVHDGALVESDAGRAVLNEPKNPFLVALGDRVRATRATRGMARKALAQAADVSERHLANLEYGIGNASILVLLQVAQALRCSLSDLIDQGTAPTQESLLIQDMLAGQDEPSLRRLRLRLAEVLQEERSNKPPNSRIALVGLRGAGKSTLGKMIAADFGFPFVELSREIEKIGGGTIGEIQALYGVSAYRRYEMRAMTEVLQRYSEVVIATPGGVVADSGSFNLMLGECTTVWLEASPEDHMNRVIAQGDMRPIAASKEAMEDLKAILAGRSAFYSKANYRLNTSLQNLDASFLALRAILRKALQIPAGDESFARAI
jgi:XRE family transcriptional regulator, aerobic/anaerobic benzoate catabolism transcriptional regulator